MTTTRHISLLAVALSGLIPARTAAAHCDTTRGPVVTAARSALEAGDVDLVLHWVRPEEEAEVRAAFRQAMEVRRLGPAARELADRHFFETLVRIHRAGEGAPYTGLSDAAPDALIAATDRALELGSADEVDQHLVDVVENGLARRYAAARAARDFRPGDVEAGRAYVAAYVALTHWVEGVAAAAEGPGGHHAGAPEHHAVTRDPGGSLARSYLPWLIAGLLAVATLLEGALLLRRRRHTTV